MSGAEFSLYILECVDGSLYTGIACDVQSRIADHKSGKRGAKYLRGRAPYSLVYVRTVGDRGTAQSVEHKVKQWTRQKKLDLIAGRVPLDLALNR